METEDTTALAPPPAPTKKAPVPRADQDQLIANRIADTRRKITAVLADDDLKARFAAHADLRSTIKLAFPRDKVAQQTLGATGRVPLDDDKFLTAARAAGHAATQEPYAATLTKRGHKADAYTATLSAFDTAHGMSEIWSAADAPRTA
jgi:hypothetical protein